MFENKNAADISIMIRQKEVKPSEVCGYFLARAKETEPDVNAFITLSSDLMERAEKLDQEPISSATSPLFGLPIAIKDNISTSDMPTTCASKMLANYRPPYDATVISRLREQGVLVIGKTNMDEFAMGASGETSFFQPTHNPHDLSRVPGGSSSGSAATVACGSAPLSLGSDTGGSIRNPASSCGVVGLKPTYGAVSRYGLLAYANSFDQIGTFAKTVTDTALLTAAIVGHDQKDATSSRDFTIDTAAVEAFSVKGKKIGILKECFAAGIANCVDDRVMAAANTFASMGAKLVDVSIPSINDSLSAYYAIALSEASSNLSKYDGLRFGYRAAHFDDLESLYINSRSEGFGEEVKRRIIIGTYILSSGNYDKYYRKARILQATLQNDFAAAFMKCDILLSPVTPQTARPLGYKETNPDTLFLGDVCTVPVNLAGLPAISVPCGLDHENMPIGVQLIGRKFSDTELLGYARVFERESN